MFIPASGNGGPHTVTNGASAPPVAGAVRSWRSVLPSYSSGARAGVESGAVPAGSAGAVLRYFDELDRLAGGN